MKNCLVQALRTTNSLICKTGIENAYRRAFLDGRGSSIKDGTFNKKKREHTCCGSKVVWRHKVCCKLEELEGNQKWKDLGE